MKNVGNTSIVDNFTIQDTLTVGETVTTQVVNASNNITTQILDAAAINTATLLATESIAIPTFGSINFGINPFKYSRGTYTPQSRCIESDGSTFYNSNWHDSSGQSGQGYYERYGNVVTAYFKATVNFGGTLNDYIYRIRIPVIDNLPFTCANRGGAPSVASSCAITSSSFPNGYVAGLAAPLTVTMDGGFQGTIYEDGEIFTPAFPPLYTATSPWTSNGKTLIITCSQSQYTLAGLTTFGGLEGPAYNFNVIVTGSYTSEFRGTITYFTNE